VYYEEWTKTKLTDSDDPEEDKRLVFGMVFSFKGMINSMSPEEATSGYRKIVCGSFILHCFETLSGLRFIINTDRSCDNLQDTLRHLYANIFIDTVAKNPLYRYQIGENIVCPLFEEQLHEYFSLLPGFS